MRYASLFFLSFFLVGCELSASLLGGGGQESTFAPTYMVNGQEHSISVTFVVESGVVTSLRIAPGAVTGSERGKQLAFSANIRKYVLEKNLSEIAIPDVVGEEDQLTELFRGLVTQLMTSGQ